MGRLTLWGMQQYDPTLMSGVSLPDGMNAETFKTLLMSRMGPQYPRIQVPPMLKILIGNWFQMRQKDFEMMWEAYSAEYNPIENYDRKEDRTENLTHSGKDTDTDTLGTSVTLKRTGTETDATNGEDASSLSVSAYDSADYQPRERNVRTPNLTSTRTPDLTDVSKNSGEDIHKREYGHVEDTTETIRAHGNIGVTTNQQMVEAELNLRAQWNVYDIIMRLFEDEFLCRLY